MHVIVFLTDTPHRRARRDLDSVPNVPREKNACSVKSANDNADDYV